MKFTAAKSGELHRGKRVFPLTMDANIPAKHMREKREKRIPMLFMRAG